MKLSDEMIFVLNVYNRLSEKTPFEDTVKSQLDTICKKLVKNGEISEEAYKYCSAALFEKEREKMIEEIEDKAIERFCKEEGYHNFASPYSNDVEDVDIEKLLDEVLHDKPSITPSTTPKSSATYDPCGHSYIRSGC